jgi:hypothetical protein
MSELLFRQDQQKQERRHNQPSSNRKRQRNPQGADVRQLAGGVDPLNRRTQPRPEQTAQREEKAGGNRPSQGVDASDGTRGRFGYLAAGAQLRAPPDQPRGRDSHSRTSAIVVGVHRRCDGDDLAADDAIRRMCDERGV